MAFGNQFGSAGRDHGSWPVLLVLLVAVLAPTACVLWFMNEAVESQQEAARLKLADAYRGQLALMRDRLETLWARRAAELDRLAGSGEGAAAFAAIVRAGAADSAICFSREGLPAYPAPLPAPALDAEPRTGLWAEARSLESTPAGLARAAEIYGEIAAGEKQTAAAGRAVQAQVRCLVRSGQEAAALRVIEQQFQGARLSGARDPQGRLIAADAQLLAVQIGRRRGPWLPAARLLEAMVNDYASSMPSTQRVFLMEELRALGDFQFATYEAERLAAALLAAERARPGEAALRQSAIPGLWRLDSPGGRALGIYREATALEAMRRSLDEQSPSGDVAFHAVPPAAPGGAFDESLAAGRTLPGWQIAMTFGGGALFADVARRQLESYLWVGFLAIAAMAVLAVIVAQALRRQIRLARLKTDLVAAVSHELKTPLASMRLLVDALLDEGQFEPRKTREYLELVARENVRLSRLIDNFLTFSRMERNRHRFDLAASTAAGVVTAVEEALSERFRSPGVRLEVDVAPGLPAVRADADALVTALLNLLDNAYKFTGEDKRLRLRAFESEGRVAFAIEDNGIGIPARERKRIFRRFYQVDRRLSRGAGGCGLGLSIVDYIVRAHRGEVRVESRPGEGSTFTVLLPPAANARGAAA